VSQPTVADDPFSTFAEELSRNLPLITRLLAEHPAEGPCTGCRLPGPTGAPQAPCAVRTVALLALQIRVLQETEAAEDADAAPIDHPGAGGDPADDSASQARRR
jgi:hypothetical protein